jgi:hypothetical protein
MKKNMGSADKVIRIVVAALFAVLYLTGVIKGTLGIILLLIALVFVITSFFGVCPLYSLFGLNTMKKE